MFETWVPLKKIALNYCLQICLDKMVWFFVNFFIFCIDIFEQFHSELMLGLETMPRYSKKHIY